ncbi:hypothetical protein M501DRAFT_999272 [Patellaria atrata CBS 101060]|uniref:Uncharacterized protein n=1 Tax=Patellaria atrata CBS 101060 TaxID=1346257 RepID=A0A9P4S311_9PEZI|nr:hypothetical protein M501DRAFT_999272 [Patellaria atrata CBS 101060]
MKDRRQLQNQNLTPNPPQPHSAQDAQPPVAAKHPRIDPPSWSSILIAIEQQKRVSTLQSTREPYATSFSLKDHPLELYTSDTPRFKTVRSIIVQIPSEESASPTASSSIFSTSDKPFHTTIAPQSPKTIEYHVPKPHVHPPVSDPGSPPPLPTRPFKHPHSPNLPQKFFRSIRDDSLLLYLVMAFILCCALYLYNICNGARRRYWRKKKGSGMGFG